MLAVNLSECQNTNVSLWGSVGPGGPARLMVRHCGSALVCLPGSYGPAAHKCLPNPTECSTSQGFTGSIIHNTITLSI